jgi:hypothetical protein
MSKDRKLKRETTNKANKVIGGGAEVARSEWKNSSGRFIVSGMGRHCGWSWFGHWGWSRTEHQGWHGAVLVLELEWTLGLESDWAFGKLGCGGRLARRYQNQQCKMSKDRELKREKTNKAIKVIGGGVEAARLEGKNSCAVEADAGGAGGIDIQSINEWMAWDRVELEGSKVVQAD